jgi:short-subunit dehydrogenase
MAQDLRGKRVLVTGASSGIGRAAAKAFAGAGASVLVVARSEEKLDALAAEIGGPPKAVPLPADVADGASMAALAEEVLLRYGPPDVIVAGAGIGMDARFAETSDDDFRRVLEVNVLGVLRTIRPFLPAMVARGSGRILLISSVVGKRGVPNYTAYSASKFALHGMADALRPELYGTGVTVGIVCPSSTSTEFDTRKIRAGIAQPRVRVQRHTPESVAAALVRMARSTRREVVLSVEGKFMSWANRWAPGLLDIVLAKALVKKRG